MELEVSAGRLRILDEIAQLHLRAHKRRDMSANFNAVDAALTMDLHVQDTPAAHLRSLLANEARSRGV